jgi:F-type H+-transporting ATPase subunit b
MRTWLAGAGVVALASLGVGLPAAAQEEEPAGEEAEEAEHDFADEEAEHCYELLAEGGEVDDCQEAPSPLLPETNEIIWGSIAFLVLLGALWKWGIPAVRNMTAMREERIRTDLERAESARTEAERALEDYRAQLAQARQEAGRIIDEARQAADDVRSELIARAEAEAGEIRDRAQQDVQVAADRAKAELRSWLGDTSIDIAEKIIEQNLDRDTQRALVERYIDTVGR